MCSNVCVLNDVFLFCSYVTLKTVHRYSKALSHITVFFHFINLASKISHIYFGNNILPKFKLHVKAYTDFYQKIYIITFISSANYIDFSSLYILELFRYSVFIL